MTKILERVWIFYPVLLAILLCSHCGQWGKDSDNRDGTIVKKPDKERLAAVTEQCKEVLALKKAPPLGAVKELEKRFLDAHNEIRKIYKLPALTWDSSLAAYAQRWAEYQKAHDLCRMEHRSHKKITEGKKYGENLAYNWQNMPVPKGRYLRSPESVVKSWSAECEDYHYAHNSCQSGKMCGHFTQIVWHSTQRVGCGMVTCDDNESWYQSGRLELWVCNYDPPGNYIGQWPY